MGKPNAKIPLILSLILILLTCSANGQKQSSPNKITDFYFLKPLHGFTYENVDFNDKGCELSKESATGLIITSKVKVPWRKVSPFLAFSCGAFVENYTMDNFKIYVRTYSNREKWSNWAELKMGSEIELSPTTFTSELQYYNPHTTYIQIKIELSGNANSKILIKQLSLNFINPSVKLGQIEESNKISEPNSTNSVCPCPMPAYSTRSSWGAPSGPTCSPNPSSTVSHLIIHHQGQSGSISAPYANDVYSIYVYHTSPQPSGNGWCDIGYNWLIDPNGQLYEGRGGSISNNIIGAHFSCMNTGTMGVCLLNNFDTFSPQPNAISKLEELLAWKCCDVGIPPIGTAFHSASGLTLNRISGHSNGNSSALGCPTGTSCPGTNLYSLLPTIRNAVNTIINSCNGGGCSQPTNDGCSGSFSAIPLTFGTSCNPTSATSCGATSSGFASCVGNQDDDVFSFSPTSTSATISIVSSTGYDAVFQVLSGSCGGSMTQLVCIDNTGTGNTETTTINVAIGSTYFIRVWDYFSGSGTSGNFTICVYGSGGCTPPGTPTLTFGSNSCPGSAGNNISPPGTPLTWNTVSGANGYKIYVSKYPYGSSCLLSGYNPFPCSNYSGQIVMSAALDPGMLYRWNVYATSDCSNSSCDSPISTTKYFYTPPTISPSTSQTICQGNSVLFSTTAANVCSGNPVTYQWYRNSAPISGATNTTYSATLSGTYYVEFNFSGSSSCSSASIQSSSVNITVNPIPSCSNITGVTTVCQGSTQSYSASCSNATSYNWSVPIGWTITSGQGTSSINVTVGANSGQVCVTPSNSCGNGTQTCVSVTVSSTPSCSNITGSNNCMPRFHSKLFCFLQ
ncbi:MAG: N-acetylmuramoyl-L-alanine amidase [Bacteroidetes bacterium]|nr:N-acetylmuramoyl-L-alanine amidase [Bacteroidota bacterium]